MPVVFVLWSIQLQFNKNHHIGTLPRMCALCLWLSPFTFTKKRLIPFVRCRVVPFSYQSYHSPKKVNTAQTNGRIHYPLQSRSLVVTLMATRARSLWAAAAVKLAAVKWYASLSCAAHNERTTCSLLILWMKNTWRHESF